VSMSAFERPPGAAALSRVAQDEMRKRQGGPANQLRLTNRS
jgi:hypothetical protein